MASWTATDTLFLNLQTVLETLVGDDVDDVVYFDGDFEDAVEFGLMERATSGKPLVFYGFGGVETREQDAAGRDLSHILPVAILVGIATRGRLAKREESKALNDVSDKLVRIWSEYSSSNGLYSDLGGHNMILIDYPAPINTFGMDVAGRTVVLGIERANV